MRHGIDFRRAPSSTVALTLALALSPNQLVAQPADPSAMSPPSAAAPLPARVKEEARQRFDRGLALYNSGDMPGALAEFQRAHMLTGHPIVLYNLALVHANVGDAAVAVEELEQLRKSGWAGLGTERAERAERVYQEQLLRVGTLAINADVQGALVLIDNVDAARIPAPPQRVNAGKHIVGLSAQGYEPRRVSVTVAGQAREEVTVTLVPLADALAHLELASDVPDVTVSLDGSPLGRTPFPSAIAFKPGQHELEWSRDGYVPVRRTVTLQPGTSGKLSVPMVPSDAGLAAGGTLAFRLSEPNAVVTIDGKPTVDHATGIHVPVGRHDVRIERAGFFDVDRQVAVAPGSNSVEVQLLPTPEHLGDYVARAERQRLWSYIAGGAGVLIAGGSTAFLVWNQGEKNEAEKAFNDFADSVKNVEPGTCTNATCEKKLVILADDLEAKRSRDVYGWVGLGVGLAAIGTGVLLFATGDDPGRYDPRPESDVFGSLRVRASVGSASVSGSF
jgi:hypothetical protein